MLLRQRRGQHETSIIINKGAKICARARVHSARISRLKEDYLGQPEKLRRPFEPIPLARMGLVCVVYGHDIHYRGQMSAAAAADNKGALGWEKTMVGCE